MTTQQINRLMANTFPTTSLNPAFRMHECGVGNYWFYHRGSFPFDEPLYYQYLIDNATSYVEIWDPYFNVTAPSNDQSIFSNINDNVTIKILTMKGLDGPLTYLTNVENAIKTVIPTSKNIRFGLRVINRGDISHQGERFFHDRYLIINQTDVYLVGSSISCHLRPKESTGIYRVTGIDTSAFIISLFSYYWNNSPNHEIPIRYL